MTDKAQHTMTPLETLRHSAAHVMADAVQRLFPEAKVTIGPPVEGGFYYDFDYSPGFSTADLEKIEAVMREIVAANLPFERREVSKKEASAIFEKRQETYKLELISGIPGETVTIYRHGQWEDLCRGPHVKRTGEIKAFKLLKVAGAYWHGDEKNPQLQRIYGTAFPSEEELTRHLELLAEAQRRDHRRLGRELDLFSSMEESGAGLILWHPKGGRVRRAIEDYWREAHTQNGYELVFTPHIARLDLWKQSGHWDFYREHMYSPMVVDGVEYELKPMNCPFHIQIFKTKLRSYREFPLRWAELGTVYRYERSGVLHGLLRVRGFTQDDAHIFCRPDQLEVEIGRTLRFCVEVLSTFGFNDYDIFLSTMPAKHVGSLAAWQQAEAALAAALTEMGLRYEVDQGEGVFYGPKIDIKIKDSLGRAWQCSTIQVDFNLPDRYQLEFAASDGTKQQPIMVHRALLGSLERFFGVLIEHYAGALPTWLAPVQAILLTVSDAEAEIAARLKREWDALGLRIDVDDRGEKLGLKVREATLAKIPYLLVVGKKEAAAGTVAVRTHRGEDLGQLTAAAFVEKLQKEVRYRTT